MSRWKRNGTEVVGQKTDNGLVRRGGLGGIRNIKCDTKTEFILFYESLGGPWILILLATAQILCWVWLRPIALLHAEEKWSDCEGLGSVSSSEQIILIWLLVNKLKIYIYLNYNHPLSLKYRWHKRSVQIRREFWSDCETGKTRVEHKHNSVRLG